ncbi:MAG: ABC transporter ATP-binding protein [bacterium]|nr:ABC transporter ATP-binding protein [bacterium]
MSFVRAQGLEKTYAKEGTSLSVLKGIDLTIKKGECLFITGASGAGKSTLLHLLGSLETPTQGTLFYEDQNIAEKSDKELARFRNETIGFVFQFHYLLNDFTALENVMMPLLLRKQGKKEAAQAAQALLERLQLTSRKDHRPPELSGGERQRIAVARALVTRPKILYADEPTGNLDSKTGEELLEILLDYHLQDQGTVVMVTHNEALLRRAETRTKIRTLHLVDGKIS